MKHWMNYMAGGWMSMWIRVFSNRFLFFSDAKGNALKTINQTPQNFLKKDCKFFWIRHESKTAHKCAARFLGFKILTQTTNTKSCKCHVRLSSCIISCCSCWNENLRSECGGKDDENCCTIPNLSQFNHKTWMFFRCIHCKNKLLYFCWFNSKWLP